MITLGTLKRVEGNAYRGRFVFPDSLVYAALAVEDTLAHEVDDFGGRAWEVPRVAPDERRALWTRLLHSWQGSALPDADGRVGRSFHLPSCVNCTRLVSTSTTVAVVVIVKRPGESRGNSPRFVTWFDRTKLPTDKHLTSS